jgi:hypothetical protein
MPAYRAACRAACMGNRNEHEALRFGLHRFEPAERGLPDARPLWLAEIDPSVLCASASPCAVGDGEGFDIAAHPSLAMCHHGENGKEYWLFSDGLRQIRLDIITGTLAAGPVLLEYRLSGLLQVVPQLSTLHRLIALSRAGKMVPALFPQERRAKRWTLVLRTWDALTAEVSQREMACEFFGLGDVSRWRSTAPSWRRRVQRLVEAAKRTANTDPRAWLGGTFP